MFPVGGRATTGASRTVFSVGLEYSGVRSVHIPRSNKVADLKFPPTYLVCIYALSVPEPSHIDAVLSTLLLPSRRAIQRCQIYGRAGQPRTALRRYSHYDRDTATEA
jgi:hypothetical protein